MAGELILLTGATGFIGFATLRLALKHGYKIRAAVRSEKKAETVRSNPTLKDISEDQLSFVVVPDFIAEGAFDEAAKDVDYILHIASPIPSDNLSGDSDLYAALIQPAEKATLGIFKSAQKSKTTKRVVVTSSAAAIVPISAFTGTDEIYTPDHRTEPLPPPYFNNVQAAYGTAKCLALKSAEDFMANEKPAFDAIHIHPSVVLGRDERALTTETLKDDSSNAIVLKLVLGQNHDGFPISVAHIEDVAEAHVRALGPKVKGNQSFLVSSKGDEGNTWNGSKDYVKKHFPQAVESGLLPNNGEMPSAILKVDVSKTEEQLGIKAKSYEEMIIDLIGQYIELAKKEESA